MLGGSQYDRAFDAYSRAMKANNNFGMTDKQQIADQYGRQAVALQQRQIKAENKKLGKGIAKEKAIQAKQAAANAAPKATPKSTKVQMPKISESLSGKSLAQSFPGIKPEYLEVKAPQATPAVTQTATAASKATAQSAKIQLPKISELLNGKSLAQSFPGIKPEYLEVKAPQAASVEMPAEPVSLVGKTKKQIQKEQKKLWKEEQKKTNAPEGTKNATPANQAGTAQKPVATGNAQTTGATPKPAATGNAQATGATPKPAATGSTQTTGATPKPAATGSTQSTGATPKPAATGNAQTTGATPKTAATPKPKTKGFFGKIGSKLKGIGTKLTKTKAGKAGLIAVGAGLLIAGAGYLISKLGKDDDKKDEKLDNKNNGGDKVDDKNNGNGNGGKVDGKDKDNGNGGKVDGKDKDKDNGNGGRVDGKDKDKDNGNGGRVDGKDDGIDNGNKVHSGTHKVVKGETIHKIVTDALKEQGIEEPTDEQIKKAKRALLEENADAVQTYTGKKKEWHGNKFFFPDEELTIPDYKKLLEETEEEQAA